MIKRREFLKKSSLLGFLGISALSFAGGKDKNSKIITDNNTLNKIIERCDERGNIVYYRFSNGRELWYKYDKNNNLIHFKNSNDYENWSEYDENNKLIYSKNSFGYESWRKYDKNNNLIHSKDSCGNECRKKYNSSGKCIEKLEKTIYKA